MPSHYHAYKIVGGVALVSACLSQVVLAVGRAGPAQIAKLAKNAEKLLSAPAANYEKIVARWIKPKAAKEEELLTKLQRRLDSTVSTKDQAALQALMGEVCYWAAPAKARALGSPRPFREVGSKAIPHFLSAWRSIAASEEEGGGELRRRIQLRLRSLVATRVCGAELSASLKKQVVSEFVDVVEASPEGESENWTLEQKSRVYANLGIADRLLSDVPVDIPEEYADVVVALQTTSCLQPRSAVRFAEALEDQHQKRLSHDLKTRYMVLDVYRTVEHERTLPCVKAICEQDAGGYLVLYDISRNLEKDLSHADRFKYVQEYLKRAGQACAGSLERFHLAIKPLVAARDFSNALDVIEAGLTAPGLRTFSHLARLHYSRALCYEQLGMKGDAVASCRKAVEMARLAEEAGGSNLLVGVTTRALSRLEAATSRLRR